MPNLPTGCRYPSCACTYPDCQELPHQLRARREQEVREALADQHYLPTAEPKEPKL